MYSNEPVEFSVDVKGEKTGEHFPGVFRARPRISHMDDLRMDQIVRDLLGKNPKEAGEGAINVAKAFAKIWVHLVVDEKTPRWWTESGMGIRLLDEDPVAAVYQNVLRIEREALEEVLKKGEEAKAELKKPAKE